MSVSSHVQNDREDENQAIDRMFAFVKHVIFYLLVVD